MKSLMKALIALLTLLCQGLALAAPAHPLAGQTITFCADDAQWPPYSYTRPANHPEVEGFTIELIRRAFADHGIQARFEQMPWKRCLAESARGNAIQVALDASYSDERAGKYLLTRQYYELTPHYFYSRRQHPQGLSVNSPEQLLGQGKVCGLSGYNYDNFGIASEQIYRGARDFYALAAMTHRGRCALFLGRYEIVAGLARINGNLLKDPDLAYQPIPRVPREPFYMLISRGYPQAQALKQLLDESITRMENDGTLKALLERHLLPVN